MIDTHSHILAGIDDGSRSLEDSVRLCRVAAEDGIETTVCTPHISFRYENRRETIEPPFEALSREVREAGIPIRLIKGAEVHMASDILAKVKGGDLMTYNDGRKHLLLEFPFQAVITGDEEIVYRLRLASVTPVIAHPERIAYFMEQPDRLHRLVRLGALGQITGGSVLGDFGDASQRAAFTMIERRLAHVVASDAHDLRFRRPVLAGAVRQIAERFGKETARTMSEDNPRALVEGLEIDPPEPIEAPDPLRRIRGWFGRRR